MRWVVLLTLLDAGIAEGAGDLFPLSDDLCACVGSSEEQGGEAADGSRNVAHHMGAEGVFVGADECERVNVLRDIRAPCILDEADDGFPVDHPCHRILHVFAERILPPIVNERRTGALDAPSFEASFLAVIGGGEEPGGGHEEAAADCRTPVLFERIEERFSPLHIREAADGGPDVHVELIDGFVHLEDVARDVYCPLRVVSMFLWDWLRIRSREDGGCVVRLGGCGAWEVLHGEPLSFLSHTGSVKFPLHLFHPFHPSPRSCH